MIRFLLFRVLPRRLTPILVIFQVVSLVRRWRGRHDRTREIDETDRSGPER